MNEKPEKVTRGASWALISVRNRTHKDRKRASNKLKCRAKVKEL